MASKLTSCFVCWNLTLTRFNCNHPNARVRFPSSPSHRLLPASCKMRHRTLSSQLKKQQQIKKASQEQPSTDGIGDPHPNQDEDSKVSLDTITNLNKETLSSTHTENSDSVQHTNVENLNGPIVLAQTTPLVA